MYGISLKEALLILKQMLACLKFEVGSLISGKQSSGPAFLKPFFSKHSDHGVSCSSAGDSCGISSFSLSESGPKVPLQLSVDPWRTLNCADCLLHSTAGCSTLHEAKEFGSLQSPSSTSPAPFNVCKAFLFSRAVLEKNKKNMISFHHFIVLIWFWKLEHLNPHTIV